MSLRVTQLNNLTADDRDQVARLVRSSPGTDQNPPLSEQATLRLAADAAVGHFLAYGSDDGVGEIVGYAQHETAAHSVELVTAPGPDSTHVSRALIAAVQRGLPGQPLSLWAHGRLSAAEAFAQAEAWRPVRELLQLRRSLSDLTAENSGGADADDEATIIRTFRPEADDDAWLALNAVAFADHPEQGTWSARDLADRLRSSWFDPAGFFVAERDGQLIGFHWTKVHHELDPAVGEVYILGVHPAARGRRLAQRLLTIGLGHLSGLGLATVLLYVEGDNTPAVRLYEKHRFSAFSQDIQYVAPPS